jgi:ABC-type bacteriocin/lantibiotic exporter with double-glycine peptidase domain
MRRKVAALWLVAYAFAMVVFAGLLSLAFSNTASDYVRAALEGARYLDRQNVVLQKGARDCAVACVDMVLKRHGQQVEYARLRALTGLTARGASMLDIRRTLEALGATVETRRIGWSDLMASPLPAIAFIHKNHFVVVESVSDAGVVVLDPSIGRVRFTRWLFSLNWDGEIVLAQFRGNNPQPAANLPAASVRRGVRLSTDSTLSD